MKTPLISIIIPIYNAEKYIEECLQSVLTQTQENIEVLCVNDGSTDSSLEILEKYSKEYDNLQIINQENAGVSVARNNGIKQAKAPYIMFVDSDDTLKNTACEIAYNKINEFDADVVMYSCALVYNNELHPRFAFSEAERIFNQDECHSILYRRCFGLLSTELDKIEQQDYMSPVWIKLYKKDIILENNIEFYDIKKIGSFEDGFFNLQYFNFVKKAIYLPDVLYYYRRDNSESNTSKYKEKLPKQWTHLFSLIKNEIQRNSLDENFTEALNNRIAISSMGQGLNAISKKSNIIEHTRLVKSILSQSEYRQAIKKMNFRTLRIHWKVFFFCCKYKMSFLVVLLLYAINFLRRL